MKRIFKKIVPILLSMFIVIGVVFSSYDTAKATGMEEYLYVTYWDLMNTLYSMCGYDMKVSDNQIKNHGVTGKQAWNNFTTFVENAAKIHWKAFSEAGSSVVKELKNLVNTATEKGISISQDLYDMLKDVFGYQAEYYNKNVCFDTSSVDSVNDFIKSVSGCYNTSLAEAVYSGKCRLYVLSGIRSGKTGRIAFGVLSDTSFPLFITYDKSSGLYSPAYNYNGRLITVGSCGNFCCSDGTVVDDVSVEFWESAPSFIINDGCWSGTDVVSAQVSAGACPAEVPDVKPWIKSPDIPDEFRIVKPGEAPGQKPDPDEHPDWLPGIIPFKPKTPQKPEDPKDPEKPKPDKDKDKDKKRKPAWNPIINPQTGNVIDPETGLDIDPETGKLIDPETGKLIDPDDAGSGGGGGGGIADKLGKYGDITKLFPFCIPFDIVNLIKGMSAEKAPPVFHFKYYFKSINYTFKVDVDLSKYAKYIKLFRYRMQIFYILALMFMTIRISKSFT